MCSGFPPAFLCDLCGFILASPVFIELLTVPTLKGFKGSRIQGAKGSSEKLIST
jgi:hypothetical protein